MMFWYKRLRGNTSWAAGNRPENDKRGHELRMATAAFLQQIDHGSHGKSDAGIAFADRRVFEKVTMPNCSSRK